MILFSDGGICKNIDKRIFNHLDASLIDFSIEISVHIFTVAQDGIANWSMLFIGS